MIDETNAELARVFFPYYEQRKSAVIAAGDRFAYYTNAETASKILGAQEFWLRNALVMNDFSEIAHGMECLRLAYDSSGGKILRAGLESCFPGITGEIEAMYNRLVPLIRYGTFITCFSEHSPAEDTRGRLSMWRAYGGTTGVAIVINGAVMHSESAALGAFSSPVYYGDLRDFGAAFDRVALGIAGRPELLAHAGRDRIRELVFHMLRFTALCTKHPAFHEELEWRVIASPSIINSERLIPSLEVVRGVPQQVLKIRLANAPELGLVGLAIPELIDRVIVGPCEFPEITATAFRERLKALAVPDWEERVVVADVPLRHHT